MLLRSSQNVGGVYKVSLGDVKTTFVPSSIEDGKGKHETTVHATQGELNIVDPFNTKKITDKDR